MNYSAAEGDYDKYLAIANDIMQSFKTIEEKTTMIGKTSAIPDLPDVKY